MRRRTLGFLGGTLLVFGLYSCSFGLDPSLYLALQDGAVGPGLGPDGEVLGEGGADADGGKPPPGDGAVTDAALGTTCTMDSECPSSDACLAGRCDVARGVCAYDVCPAPMGTCRVSVCDRTSSVCGAPAAAYPYHAGSFEVGAAAPCTDNDVSACIAAAYPFVFVLTSAGVRAFSAVDPTTASPRAITVTGAPFAPARIVSAQKRVYLVSAPDGASVKVAWIDLPTDPFTATLAVSSAHTVSFTQDAGTAFAGAPDSLFVVGQLEPYPVAKVVPPAATDPIASFPLPALEQYSSPVAASGDRVLVRISFGSDYRFALNAGTATTTLSPDAGSGTTLLGQLFGQGPEGTVLLHGAEFAGSLGNFGYSRTQLHWLVSGATAPVDGTKSVLVESYPSLATGYPLGPVAWLDPQRVLVVAEANGSGGASSSVQIATKQTTPPSLVAARRFVLPLSPSKLGASASNGTAYVLTQAGTVHVFDPDCAQ